MRVCAHAQVYVRTCTPTHACALTSRLPMKEGTYWTEAERTAFIPSSTAFLVDSASFSGSCRSTWPNTAQNTAAKSCLANTLSLCAGRKERDRKWKKRKCFKFLQYCTRVSQLHTALCYIQIPIPIYNNKCNWLPYILLIIFIPYTAVNNWPIPFQPHHLNPYGTILQCNMSVTELQSKYV